MQGSNYDPIADEYYDPRHITSRNFDAATEAFLLSIPALVPSSGLVLEIGAGRGTAQKYCCVPSCRVVQADISRRMLLLTPREPSSHLIECDAFRLPFRPMVFAAVLAFLLDPYNTEALYFSVYRILKPGGLFLGTFPHPIWGQGLRKSVGYQPDKTFFRRYLSDAQEMVEIDSFLMTDIELTRTLSNAGFVISFMVDLFLPQSIQDISPHILIPASQLGLTPHTLPIVKLFAVRRPE